MKPRIAVSLSLEAPSQTRHLFKGKALQYIEQEIVSSVFRAGGSPLLIPFWEDCEGAEPYSELLESFDGLLLTGGVDISPESYGEKAEKKEWEGDPRRDRYEMGLFQEAQRREMPILGVCRGCQLINVAMGGSLYQDLSSKGSGGIQHRNQELYDSLTHQVSLKANSLLADLQGATVARVNSVHHQGIKELGKGLIPIAQAPDGVIEGVEGVNSGFLLGVQWHPEWLPRESKLGSQIFDLFVSACSHRFQQE